MSQILYLVLSLLGVLVAGWLLSFFALMAFKPARRWSAPRCYVLAAVTWFGGQTLPSRILQYTQNPDIVLVVQVLIPVISAMFVFIGLFNGGVQATQRAAHEQQHAKTE